MTRYYCSYFDKNYTARAVALIESLRTHEKKDFVFYAVCLDEITRLVVEKFRFPNVVTIPLHEIEYRHEGLSAARKSRTLVEYFWTLTPTVIDWLLKENPQIPAITYVDADLYFFSSPDPIFAEFEGHSVLIHEHRFPPDLKYLEVHGRYNVGLLCFRNNPEGMIVLDWWREKCLEWCYCRLEDGKFGDQLYLEDWPERFRGVRVLEHVGAGVAPWNQTQYVFDRGADGGVRVDGLPLVFYHFHSFSFAIPGVVVPARFPQYNPMKTDIIRLCVLPYVRHLHDVIARVKENSAGSSFGTDNPDLLNTLHTIVVHRSLAESFVHAIRSSEVSMPPPQEIDGEWLVYNGA